MRAGSSDLASRAKTRMLTSMFEISARYTPASLPPDATVPPTAAVMEVAIKEPGLERKERFTGAVAEAVFNHFYEALHDARLRTLQLYSPVPEPHCCTKLVVESPAPALHPKHLT